MTACSGGRPGRESRWVARPSPFRTNAVKSGDLLNLTAGATDASDAPATFVGSYALPAYLKTRDAVVGNGNSDVGKTPTPESGQPIVEGLVRRGGFGDLQLDPPAPPQRESAVKCGAMSEQSADSGRGNEQVPQKLVHLVGTRDSAPRLPLIRPRGA